MKRKGELVYEMRIGLRVDKYGHISGRAELRQGWRCQSCTLLIGCGCQVDGLQGAGSAEAAIRCQSPSHVLTSVTPVQDIIFLGCTRRIECGEIVLLCSDGTVQISRSIPSQRCCASVAILYSPNIWSYIVQ
jgi:hypothetical protein